MLISPAVIPVMLNKTEKIALSGHICKIILFIILFLGLAQNLSAASYYVDFDGGRDENSGTNPEKPFKHCPGDETATGKASSLKPAPGDTIFFKGGVYYRGTITLKSGGEAGNPLTLDGNSADNFGTGRAIIDGSEILAGGAKCASSGEAGGNPNWGKILRLVLPKGTKTMSWNLCEGDRLLFLAQQPNPKDPFWADDLESYYKVPTPACTLNSIIDKRFADFGGKELIGSQLLYFGKPNWLSVCNITGYDTASQKMSFSKGDKITGLYPSETKYALLNHVRLIDRPGEYSVDEARGIIYVWPLTEGAAGKKVFTISRRKLGIDLNGKSYVTVQGLRIQKQCAGIGEQGGTAIKSVGPATNVIIRNNEITMVRSLPRQGSIGLIKCTNSLLEKNRLWENPFFRVIILDECNDSVIRDNFLDKNGGTGIILFRTHRTKILNNTIRRHLAVHAQGMAIYADCSDILIEGNTSFDRTALTLQDGENFTVRNNVFHGGGGSTIGLWSGKALKNVFILNNVLIGSSTGPDWAKDLSIFSNNTAKDSKFIIKNNIVDGIDLGGAGAGHEVEHNLFTRSGKAKLPKGNLIEPNLLKVFVDPEKDDYRLRPESPAIAAGVDVSLLYPKAAFPDFDFQKDHDGRERSSGKAMDIGAYTFVK